MDKESEHGTIFIWIKIASFVAAVVIFCYTTFTTKEEMRLLVGGRLDRIENKLDRAITGRSYEDKR